MLVAVFLWPTLAFGWRFGVGPDGPVYLWWARIAASEGISSVGARPGTPGLIPAVAGALHLPLIPAVAGLQYAMGAAVGLATVALVRGRTRGGTPRMAVGRVVRRHVRVHLAAGYLANIAFVLTFVAGAAMLARQDRRGTVAAAVLLGGGGLSHPQFFLVGAAVLLAAAGLAWIAERTSAGDPKRAASWPP